MRFPFVPANIAIFWLTVLRVSGCAAPQVTVRRVAPAPAAFAGASTPASASPSWATAASLRTLEHHDRGSANPAGGAGDRQAAAQLIDAYGAGLLAAPRCTLRVPSGPGGGSWRLILRRGAGPGGVEPGRFASLEPTDHFRVEGGPETVRTVGKGVPLVGTLKPVLAVHVAGLVPPQPVAGLAWAVTAVPVFLPPVTGHGEPTLALDLYDPHITGLIPGSEGHESRPLAADYTTPLAVVYGRFGPQRRGWRGFLGRSNEYFSSTGIYASEKPTPDKAPLVLVHGLLSDPSDFHDLQVFLERDAAVRRRYQIWYFYYPSSLPVPYSAMQLREDLAAFIHRLDPTGTHPALHRAVLVGHSMGGLLCRLAILEGGDVYLRHFFRQPLTELHLTPAQRDLVRRTFYYRASPDVAQVVFIATPHRGSRLAGGLLGSLGRLLVRVPLAVRARIQGITASNRPAMVPGAPIKPDSSLTSLSPRDPVIAAINEMPMRPGVGLHSIMGDRGRDGPPERSSDGVVTYKSSHLSQARSERLVPAGHIGTLKRPETADEIIHILQSSGGTE